MPYFFRCDYCNTEAPMDSGEDMDMYILCESCGQDMCPECAIKVDGDWLCDDCEGRRLKEALEEE